MLAFESPMLLAVTALFCAATHLLRWRRDGERYRLPLVGGWFALCIYWSLLAISAGPAPVLSRAYIAMVVRVLGILAACLMLTGGGLMLWRMVCNGRARARLVAQDNST